MASLTRPEAITRLKSNVGAISLLTFARSFFTPYLALRAMVVGVLDSFASSPRSARGSDYVWWIETAITGMLLFNIAQAAYCIQSPKPALQPTQKGLKFVPLSKSSPLTRSYNSSIPDMVSTATSAASRNTQQSPLAQSLYRSTPTRPSQLSTVTPERGAASPGHSSLSSSTARVLNLAQPGTPSSTGLFYDDTSSASPSKVARGAAGAAGTASPAPTTTRSDFVVVDREEQEWMDNVWMGVRGKSEGKIGL